MSRKSKFEEEKNRLDLVRKRLDEAIEETEGIQYAVAGNDEYGQALLYQNLAKVLKNIREVCGEGKKAGGEENSELKVCGLIE